MPENMETVGIVGLWALSVIVALFIGGFLKSYMSKKGENLATHEDMNQLVDQMRAVTSATKEIEAKISDDVWDRQQRWKLKRDILLEAAKRLVEADNAMLSLKTILEMDKKRKPEEADLGEARLKAKRRWTTITEQLDETRLFVSVLCSDSAKKAFDEFGILTNQVAANMVNQGPEAYPPEEMARKLFAARAAIRKELEIEKKGSASGQ